MMDGPSASSWRAARIGHQAEPRRRPGARPARHARGRRPAPHEPAQPVRVPHGSGQLYVYYPIGILSRRGLWKIMAQESKSDAPWAQEKPKMFNDVLQDARDAQDQRLPSPEGRAAALSAHSADADASFARRGHH